MINTETIRKEWEPAWPGDPREMSWSTIQTLCDELEQYAKALRIALSERSRVHR